MDVTLHDAGEVKVVALKGALDTLSAGPLRKRLATIVSSGAHRLVLDLTEVSRIDSQGLGTLVSTLKNVRKDDGDLVLAGLNPSVRIVIEVTRLHRVFDIYDDAETAARELGEATEPRTV